MSLLIAGWDEDQPYLFQSDPSVRSLVLSTAAYSSGLNIACAFKNAFAGHPANLKFFFILFVIGRVHISHGKPQPWGRTMLMEKHSLKKGTRK